MLIPVWLAIDLKGERINTKVASILRIATPPWSVTCWVWSIAYCYAAVECVGYGVWSIAYCVLRIAYSYAAVECDVLGMQSRDLRDRRYILER